MCKTVKDVTEFNKKKRGKYGVRGQCRDCTRYIAATYREGREDEANARSRAWYAANTDRARAKDAAYRAANPHVRWESLYRLRAQRYGLDPVIESFTIYELTARWGDACWHCGGPFEELDHWPLSVRDGGRHSLESCRPSCGTCNRQSWSKSFTA